MDSVFGIGFPELVLILLLAGIVMGPQRIRDVARWLGLITVKLQAISRTFVRQLNSELDNLDEGNDLRGAMQDVQELRRQVDELRRELMTTAVKPIQEIKAVQEEMNRSIAPPQLWEKQMGSGRATAVTPPAVDGKDGNPPTAPIPLPKLVDVPDDPA
ncbi:MAG: twin-arginine translocase TatA/TatE family subunit [Anaerolinea sp.]|nr:twin-arginine translocase TatA/TatE family subunit [Anaerolinea sp.]